MREPSAETGLHPDRIVTAAGYQGALTYFFLLYSRTSEKAMAEVLADADFLRAYLVYRRLTPQHVVTRAELLGLLRHARVAIGVDEAALDVLAEQVNADRPFPGPVQVAIGRLPVRGEDEFLEFHVRPTAAEARYETAQNGAIDYRELNLVQNCFAGQLIATRHPARAGRPGLDVHGRPLPASTGRPLKVSAGEGVAASEGGREFRAAVDGRVVFEQGVVSVSTRYAIKGDVDFRVGHIDFVGVVEIGGSVLDGFRVRGQNGVRIGGGVEGCRIESDRDIEIRGGVKGRGVARIAAGGRVAARYLDECVVEAGGDVEVGKEIVNSAVRAGGRLLAPRATFVGGDAVAFRGVHVGLAGSALGVATRVGAGVNWTDENNLQRLDDAVAAKERRVEQAESALAPLLADKRRQARLTVPERALIADLAGELNRVREELAALLRDREEARSLERPGHVARLNVAQRAFPGVVVRFPGHRHYRFTEERRGPFAITVTPDGLMNRNAAVVDLPDLEPPAPPGPADADAETAGPAAAP